MSIWLTTSACVLRSDGLIVVSLVHARGTKHPAICQPRARCGNANMQMKIPCRRFVKLSIIKSNLLPRSGPRTASRYNVSEARPIFHNVSIMYHVNLISNGQVAEERAVCFRFMD